MENACLPSQDSETSSDPLQAVEQPQPCHFLSDSKLLSESPEMKSMSANSNMEINGDDDLIGEDDLFGEDSPDQEMKSTEPSDKPSQFPKQLQGLKKKKLEFTSCEDNTVSTPLDLPKTPPRRGLKKKRLLSPNITEQMRELTPVTKKPTPVREIVEAGLPEESNSVTLKKPSPQVIDLLSSDGEAEAIQIDDDS